MSLCAKTINELFKNDKFELKYRVINRWKNVKTTNKRKIQTEEFFLTDLKASMVSDVNFKDCYKIKICTC